MSVKSSMSRSSLTRRIGADVHEKHHHDYIAARHQINVEKAQNEREDKDKVLEIEGKEHYIFCLEDFRAAVFATTMEDAITSLRVLDECNNELRIIKAMADMERLRGLKFGVEQPIVTDELEGLNKHNLGKMEYKLNKLFADRKFICDSLIKIYLELSINKNWKTLADIVNRIVDNEIHLEYLVEEEMKNKLTRRELIRQLRQQRNHVKSAVYENDVTIDRLRTQVEDAALNAEIRGRFIENWQIARTEQHHQTIVDRETVPTEVIEYYKQRTDQEQRVHSEIDLLTNLAITESLDKVEYWMDKYEKDMEALDLKIQIKKLDYHNTLEKRIELEDKIAKHQVLIENWLKFKGDREKERQYRLKMHQAAVTVQAWWRGLLVRLELGPYKRTKRKTASQPTGKSGKKKK